MSSYTITITPDDTTRASTTLRVDVSDNAARITELLVQAGAAAGLSRRQLPAFDLDLLLQAITPGATAPIPASVRPAEVPVEAAEVAEASEDRPRRGRGGRRRGTAKPPEPKATRGGAKAARNGRSKSGERAYRRAPDDLVEVFGQLGGVTAVAKHYDVPRYTAQSWIRRLRNEGLLADGG
jgi:hypothetical protein